MKYQAQHVYLRRALFSIDFLKMTYSAPWCNVLFVYSSLLENGSVLKIYSRAFSKHLLCVVPARSALFEK